jgi:hypothetical protein
VGGSQALQFNNSWTTINQLDSKNVLHQPIDNNQTTLDQTTIGAWLSCQGEDRNMYFTITRNSLTSPASDLAPATTSNSVQLVFSTYIPSMQIVSGALSTVTLSLAVTLFSLFALFSF